jgi:hypothetical protein
MPARLDIAMQRNEDWARVMQISDEEGPVDVTGWTFEMQVRERTNNDGAPIETATIEITDPENGEISIVLPGHSGQLASYGNQLQTVRRPVDLVAIEPDGFRTTLSAGYVILSRGVSH